MKNTMPVVDENGLFLTKPGTLNVIELDNPVYRARIAIALPINRWLYAPASGHTLDQYKNVKASAVNQDLFEKSLRLYLSPYGPDVVGRFTSRGNSQLQIVVTKETLNV